MTSVVEYWNRRYQQLDNHYHIAEVLQHNHYLLPKQGVALDLACGLGANALRLAEKGLKVKAWDISSKAIEQLQIEARNRGLTINAEIRDVERFPPEPESLDVLMVSHFLSREICSDLMAAIKPGGLLLYQTFCRAKVRHSGPENPDYLLEDNELLRLFSPMKLRVYREEALLGDWKVGMRNQAWLVAEKPK